MHLSPLRLVTLTVSLFAATLDLYAQPATPKVLDLNNHLWLNYSGEHSIHGRWGLHFDAQWRRSNMGTIWQQYQARPAVNYQLTKDILLTTGYAFTRAYPYGDFPVAAAFPEHRLYQQVLVNKRVKSLNTQYRTRMEQRWIRYPNQTQWTYQNRFRQMVRVEVPIGSPDEPNRWYLPVYDEILLGIPPNFGARTFDQNRIAAGIGRAQGPVKAEVVYMNQFIGQRNGRIFEFNNTLVISITSNAKLSSLWRQ